HNEERAQIASEAFGAIREIIVLNGQKFFRHKFAHSSAALSRAALNSNAIALSPRYLLEAIVAVALVVGATLSLGRDTSSGAWLAELSFLGFAAYRLLPSLQQIFHGVVKIRGDRAAFTRIAADLRAAARPKGRTVRTADVLAWQGRPHTAITLQAV